MSQFAHDNLHSIFTPTTPTRSLNTPFTPNTARPTLCTYTVQVSSSQTLTLTGGGTTEGTVTLMCDTNATPSTARCAVGGGTTLSGTLIVGIVVTNTDIAIGTLTFLVPAGWNVDLVTNSVSGTPTFSILNQTEIAL